MGHAPGAKQTRSFGDKGYELNITELKEALEAQQFRFDYLIFDDCFMANIETLYDLRSVIGYIVASPCEVMGDGFPYDRIVPTCSKRDRSRTGSRKPAGSSGTSTKTNTRARPGKSSRAASHWPSRRSWTRWRR